MESDILLKDLYKDYTGKQKKNGRLIKNLPKRWDYKDVIRLLNEKLVREVLIEEARSFKMPYGLGEIYAVKRKLPSAMRSDGTLDKTRLQIDWGETRKLWAKEYGEKPYKEYKKIDNKPMVYFSIDHRVGFRWEKANSRIKNVSYYKVRLRQTHNRYLGRYSSQDNNHKKYRILPNKKKL